MASITGLTEDQSAMRDKAKGQTSINAPTAPNAQSFSGITPPPIQEPQTIPPTTPTTPEPVEIKSSITGQDKVAQAGEHFQDILAGNDGFTSQLLNRWGEETSARESALRGSAMQQAEQAGVSQNMQNRLQRETTRELEQARQLGQAEMASDLAQRQDQSASVLADLGKYEAGVAKETFNDFVNNNDLIGSPENYAKAQELYESATGTKISLDGLVETQREAKKDVANTQVKATLDFLNPSIDPATGGYDIYDATGNITDPNLAQGLSDAWSYTAGNLDIEFDLDNPVIKDWVDYQVDAHRRLDAQTAIENTKNLLMQNPAWLELYNSKDPAVKAEALQMLDDIASAAGDATLGIQFKEDDFGFSNVVLPGGAIVPGNNTFTDAEQNTWTRDVVNGTVSVVSQDGTSSSYIYDEATGTWSEPKEEVGAPTGVSFANLNHETSSLGGAVGETIDSGGRTFTKQEDGTWLMTQGSKEYIVERNDEGKLTKTEKVVGKPITEETAKELGLDKIDMKKTYEVGTVGDYLNGDGPDNPDNPDEPPVSVLSDTKDQVAYITSADFDITSEYATNLIDDLVESGVTDAEIFNAISDNEALYKELESKITPSTIDGNGRGGGNGTSKNSRSKIGGTLASASVGDVINYGGKLYVVESTPVDYDYYRRNKKPSGSWRKTTHKDYGQVMALKEMGETSDKMTFVVGASDNTAGLGAITDETSGASWALTFGLLGGAPTIAGGDRTYPWADTDEVLVFN